MKLIEEQRQILIDALVKNLIEVLDEDQSAKNCFLHETLWFGRVGFDDYTDNELIADCVENELDEALRIMRGEEIHLEVMEKQSLFDVLVDVKADLLKQGVNEPHTVQMSKETYKKLLDELPFLPFDEVLKKPMVLGMRIEVIE